MKINVKYDMFGNIISLETIGKDVNDFSEAEQHQYDTFIQNYKEIAKLREKNFHEEKLKAFEANKNIQTTIAKSTEEMAKSSANVFASFLNTEPKYSQSNDKKIFMCRICGVSRDSTYDYFVLAKDTEDAKKIVTNHSPLMSDDIYCIDIETIKENMIKENNEIKLYG